MTRALEVPLSWLNRTAAAAVDFVTGWMLFPSALAVAGGVGIWTIVHPSLLKALSENRVPKTDRSSALLYILIAFGVVGLIYGGYVAYLKKRNQQWPASSAVYPLHRLLSGIFILPFSATLAVPKIMRTDPIFASFLIVGAAIAGFPTFLEIARIVSKRIEKGSHPLSRLLERRAGVAVLKYAPVFVVSALFVCYCILMSAQSIDGLRSLGRRAWDMTIYTNILYQSAQGDFLDCSFILSGNHASAHFDPILILFSPFFMLYQSPEFLAVLQTVWLGLGVFPVFWLTRRALGSSWAGVGIGAVYLLHPSLQRVNLFEFHSLALIGTPLLLSFCLLAARHFKRFFILLPVILLIREDAALVMCFVGIAAILARREDAWVGILTIVISVLYFVAIKAFFMNSPDVLMSGRKAYDFSNYYTYMIPHDKGLKDIVVSMFTNPIFTLRYLVSMKKLDFVLRLLAPLLFIPLLSSRWRFVLLYSVVFILLSSRNAVFSTNYHYQILAFPVLIALLPFGVERIIRRRPFGIERKHLLVAFIGTLLVSGLMSDAVFGTLIKKASRSRHARALTPAQVERYEAAMSLAEMIPQEAKVIATLNLAPYVANRRTIHYPELFRPDKPVHYLFLDGVKTKKKIRKKFDALIKEGVYEEIGRYEKIALYKLKRRPKVKR